MARHGDRVQQLPTWAHETESRLASDLAMRRLGPVRFMSQRPGRLGFAAIARYAQGPHGLASRPRRRGQATGPWFSLEVEKGWAPWALSKGDTKKAIPKPSC